jgi:hypothetical protein
MKVKIEDRYDGIEYLRMALSTCEVYVDYQTAELIDDVVTAIRKKKGNFDLLDGVKIFSEWKHKWDNYEKQKRKEATE